MIGPRAMAEREGSCEARFSVLLRRSGGLGNDRCDFLWLYARRFSQDSGIKGDCGISTES